MTVEIEEMETGGLRAILWKFVMNIDMGMLLAHSKEPVTTDSCLSQPVISHGCAVLLKFILSVPNDG